MSFRRARIALATVLAAQVVVVAYAIAVRVAFPFQIEWMTGSVLDHVERARQGLPIYTEPTASWIAYIYPPLYTWTVALLGGSAWVARLVSLASLTVQMACARKVARELGASPFWSTASAALVLACYRYVGWWYDLERTDTLFGALVLVSTLTLLRARSLPAHLLAGAVAGLAFFAKQQAVFYVAGAAFGLAVACRTDAKRARFVHVAGFATSAGVVAVPLAVWLHASSGGWFSYFVLRMPRAHGISWELAIDVFPHDIGRGFVLYAATIAIAAVSLKALRRGTLQRELAMFAAVTGAGFVAAVSSRLHIGGWINVLQPWSTLACIATVVLATRIEEAGGRRAVLLAPVLIAQIGAWVFDPREFTPRPGMLAATERFHATVRALEASGEVLVVGRGHVTRERHFQMSALADVAKVEGRSPADLVVALERRRFAAIIDDVRLPGMVRLPRWPPVMLEDFQDLEKPLLASYFVARRIPDAEAELPMIAPGMPKWVLLPRAKPLAELDLFELKRRHVREAELAETRGKALAGGVAAPFAETDIETLAAASR